MIHFTFIYCCRVCRSQKVVRNGTNRCGNAQYHCHVCGAYRVLFPKRSYAPLEKQTILRPYKERTSLRGLERIFLVARQTVVEWLKEQVRHLPPLRATLLPAAPNEVLELDEMWSFVGKKKHKRWLWTALCRRTRQIVAFVIGDRSKETCRRLWHKIPDSYQRSRTFSDFWEPYQEVFPKATHRCVGKASGETAHMERWYNSLRQRLGRYTRKTLSFSKKDAHHHMVTKWFIAEYNLNLSLTT